MGESVDDAAGPEALAFEATEADAGTRLDAFLASRVENVSRTLLKRAIEDGDVLVGGRASKPSHKLRAGERVEVEEIPAPPAAELTPEDIPLDIVYEDAEVVVVNKPAGMVVHPAAGVHSGTLANALAYRFRNADCGLRIEEGKRAPSSEEEAAEDAGGKPQSPNRNPETNP